MGKKTGTGRTEFARNIETRINAAILGWTFVVVGIQPNFSANVQLLPNSASLVPHTFPCVKRRNNEKKNETMF